MVGWVRPTDQGNAAAHADEIARLSKENAELRLKLLRNSEPPIGELDFRKLKKFLHRHDLIKVFHKFRVSHEVLKSDIEEKDYELLYRFRLIEFPYMGDRLGLSERGTQFGNQLELNEFLSLDHDDSND